MVTPVGTVTTVRRKCKTMNEEPINEYKESQMMTREFLEDLAKRGRENVAKATQALKELYEELGIVNED